MDEIQAEGGSASGYILNAVEDGVLKNGPWPPERHRPHRGGDLQLGSAQIGDRNLQATSYRAFEMGWRLATFGLFRTASVVTPKMEERGRGTILTSATAAVRGNKGQHSHAAAMGGRRMLCQSLNAEFGPKGIHVAHIIIDGAVDADTRQNAWS